MFHHLGRKTSNEVLTDVDDHESSDLLHFFVAFFDLNHLPARGFPLLSMTALDD